MNSLGAKTMVFYRDLRSRLSTGCHIYGIKDSFNLVHINKQSTRQLMTWLNSNYILVDANSGRASRFPSLSLIRNSGVKGISPYGIPPRENISHSVTPNAHTSVLYENTILAMDSKANHFHGMACCEPIKFELHLISPTKQQ